MDRWDGVLIAAAVYVAVVSLVRLMAARRDEVVRVLRAEIERQRDEQPDETQEDRDAA
jgi:hypothetical protein